MLHSMGNACVEGEHRPSTDLHALALTICCTHSYRSAPVNGVRLHLGIFCDTVVFYIHAIFPSRVVLKSLKSNDLNPTLSASSSYIMPPCKCDLVLSLKGGTCAIELHQEDQFSADLHSS